MQTVFVGAVATHIQEQRQNPKLYEVCLWQTQYHLILRVIGYSDVNSVWFCFVCRWLHMNQLNRLPKGIFDTNTKLEKL